MKRIFEDIDIIELIGGILAWGGLLFIVFMLSVIGG